MDDIKLFVKNEKEFQTLIQSVIICRLETGTEFNIENVPRKQWKAEKQKIRKE